MRFAPHLTCLLAALSLTLACTAQAPTGGAGPLDTLLVEDWAFWMSEYPEAATSVGFPGQDARWTDYSAPAIARRAARLRESQTRLQRIDRAGIRGPDELNYDLYRELLDTAVQGLDLGNDAMPIRGVIPRSLRMPLNQMEGVQQDIPRTIALMPAATVADYENIVARLRASGALIDQTIALMRQGVSQGQTPPKITLRDVAAQVQAQIVADPMSSPMLAAFRNWPAAVSAADRERLRQAAVAAFTEQTRPAFVRLHEFLAGTYVPACRETTAASALPNGAALYTYNVRWHTTTARTPREIHELGEAEVKRIRAEMDKVIASVGFRGGFDAFKQFLRTSPQFFFRDAASLVSAYRDVAKRADPELARLFGRLPQTPYGVVPVPDAVAPSQTTAYYEPGAFGAGRPGNMFANTYRLDARPRWEMEALTLHEAVPGHHLQIALAQELTSLPEFRKNSSYTAYVEGWALYAESLGEEMGFYQDPYAKFGQLTYEMWRAVRLVVDTGLHAMGWTRQQAIDFFAANTAKTTQDITVEVDRYIVWPGQALGYKMGQLKIRELRTKAERDLGPRFDVRSFHDTILGQGAVPLDVLERIVSDWTATRARR
jgi:uncharacterized protein (DUF885 family)